MGGNSSGGGGGGGGGVGGDGDGGGGGGGDGGRQMEIAMGDVQEYKDYQQVYLGGGGGGSAGVQPYHYPGGGGSVGNGDDDDDCGGEFGGYSAGYYSQVGHRIPSFLFPQFSTLDSLFLLCSLLQPETSNPKPPFLPSTFNLRS
jgi:hypothetical protein